MSVKDLGLVTAYGYAVEGGYTGTEADFKALLGNVASDLAEIENISASAETLDPGSSATASYNSGALEFGIPEGLPGRGIESIELTSTSGAVNTYTITFTDGTTFDFDVTDGEVTELSLAETLEAYAKTDGAYESMTVGNAEQLVSTLSEEDKVPYLFRTSGGSMDIGDREVDTIVGGTIAWNQLIDPSNYKEGTYNGITVSKSGNKLVASGTATANAYVKILTGQITTINGHKYAVVIPSNANISYYDDSTTRQYNAKTSSFVFSGSGVNINPYCRIDSGVTVSSAEISMQIFDLTQMLGSAVADYIYSLEQANAGSGVVWFKKLFPKPYYAYNAGELLSVSGLQSHDMTEFNQWDEEWELGRYVNGVKDTVNNQIRCKNRISIFPNTSYYFKNGSGEATIQFLDADGVFISTAYRNNASFTTPTNAHYLVFAMNSAYGTTYNNDICINLHWDGERDGEYEQYKLNSYALDSTLTLRGIPKLDANNSLYYDGDTYESDGNVTRKYGVVDLGTLSWTTTTNRAFGTLPARKPIGGNDVVGAVSQKGYNQIRPSGSLSAVGDFAFVDANSGNLIFYYDGVTLPSGYLVYELATPTTEYADPFVNPQIVDNFGTEEYLTTSIVPVGHVTQYQPNLRAKLEVAPESPDGDGDYIMRQTSGANSYVALASTNTIQSIIARLEALENA